MPFLSMGDYTTCKIGLNPLLAKSLFPQTLSTNRPAHLILVNVLEHSDSFDVESILQKHALRVRMGLIILNESIIAMQRMSLTRSENAIMISWGEKVIHTRTLKKYLY